MSESILESVKKSLGIVDPALTAFDTELIMDINMALNNLTRIGVGPERGFKIESEANTWSEFLGDLDPRLESAKEYVVLQTKLLFDSNSMSSAMIEIYNQKSDEMLYTLQVAIDPDPRSEV
jgi:hypothetical protein